MSNLGEFDFLRIFRLIRQSHLCWGLLLEFGYAQGPIIKTLWQQSTAGRKQYQTVRKKRTVDPAASKSDTLINSAVTVYPVHIDYEEEWWKHKPLSKSNTQVNGCDLISSTRIHTSQQEYKNFKHGGRRPSTPYSRNTPRSF